MYILERRVGNCFARHKSGSTDAILTDLLLAKAVVFIPLPILLSK